MTPEEKQVLVKRIAHSMTHRVKPGFQKKRMEDIQKFTEQEGLSLQEHLTEVLKLKGTPEFADKLIDTFVGPNLGKASGVLPPELRETLRNVIVAETDAALVADDTQTREKLLNECVKSLHQSLIMKVISPSPVTATPLIMEVCMMLSVLYLISKRVGYDIITGTLGEDHDGNHEYDQPIDRRSNSETPNPFDDDEL